MRLGEGRFRSRGGELYIGNLAGSGRDSEINSRVHFPALRSVGVGLEPRCEFPRAPTHALAAP